MNIENIRNIKEEINTVAATINGQLNIMYSQLVDLIVTDNINGFVIPKNSHDLSLFPSIEIKPGLTLPLGAFNDLTVFDGFNNLSDKTKEVLSNINEYCEFINIHTKDSIPEVTKNCYLSKNSYKDMIKNNENKSVFIESIDELMQEVCLNKLRDYEEKKLNKPKM